MTRTSLLDEVCQTSSLSTIHQGSNGKQVLPEQSDNRSLETV